MEIKEIMAELEYYTGVFPERAVRAAVDDRESITPELLRVLKSAANDAGIVLNNESYHLHVYALFLLAQFRENRAYPHVIALVSQPGDIPFDLFGDTITEDLGSILASLSCGEVAPLKGLIENPGVNEYVRIAALEALVTLVACGEVDRAEVVSYFKDLLKGGLEKGHTYVLDNLVRCCCYLHPEEVYEEISRACSEGTVDPSYVRLADVDRAMAWSKDETLDALKSNDRFALIQDTVASMEWWASFDSGKKTSTPELTDEQVREMLGAIVDRRLDDTNDPSNAHGKRKVGRNEPCPCGSGKKYKRCCGA